MEQLGFGHVLREATGKAAVYKWTDYTASCPAVSTLSQVHVFFKTQTLPSSDDTTFTT
jgi:hypothetical protein